MGEPRLGAMGAIHSPVAPNAVRMVRAARALREEAFTARTARRDQADGNSCTAFAWGSSLQVLHPRKIILSPQGLYYYFRKASGFQPHEDSGAYMDACARALMAWGAGSEALCEYDTGAFAVMPSAEYAAQAYDHRVPQNGVYVANTLDEQLTALDNELPVVISFDVPPGFERTAVDGEWHDDGGPARGAHAVRLCGYVLSTKRALFANSWDDDWGTWHPLAPGDGKGYFWVPFSVLAGPRFYAGYVPRLWDMVAGG